jgi:hypothetical protein
MCIQPKSAMSILRCIILLLQIMYWNFTTDYRLMDKCSVFWRTPGGKCVLCEKCTELAPTSVDFWQHCKWLMKPTTLRLLAPQVSQVNHFLVWWTFVRIRVINFSSFKSCNKIKDTYSTGTIMHFVYSKLS